MRESADSRLAELAASQFGIVTVSDAIASGLSRAQIAHRSAAIWVPVHEGVYRLPGAPSTWRGELLAAVRAATDGAAASHRSGAALYELPGGRRDLAEITCRRWDRSQRPGLVVHESRRFPWPRDLAVVDGIPTVTPELLLLQLAGWKPSPKYVEALIHAARRKRLISYDSVARDVRPARAAWTAGRAGAAPGTGTVESARPSDGERDGNPAGTRAARSRHPRARPAVRGLRRAWDLRRADRCRSPAVADHHRVRVDAGAPRRVPAPRATTGAATRSWLPDTSRSRLGCRTCGPVRGTSPTRSAPSPAAPRDPPKLRTGVDTLARGRSIDASST